MAHAVLGLTICEKPDSSSPSAESRQLRIIDKKLSIAVLAVSTVHSIQSTLERAVGGKRLEPYVSSLGAYTLENESGSYSATPKNPFTPLFSIEDVIFSAIRFAKSQVQIRQQSWSSAPTCASFLARSCPPICHATTPFI